MSRALSRARPGHTAIAEEGVGPLRTGTHPRLRLGQLLTRALSARSRELADNPPMRQDKKVSPHT